MFIDIAGFTKLLSAAKPDWVGHFMQEYYEGLRSVIESAGGRINKFIGDGIFAVFLDPNHGAAVSGSLQAAESAHRVIRSLVRRFGVEMGARVGMNSGDMLVGPLQVAGSYEFMALGDTVNIASRLEALCPLNGIMVSASIADQLPPGWSIATREDRNLRGRQGTVTVVSVCPPPDSTP